MTQRRIGFKHLPLLLVLILSESALAQQECPNNIAPCSCRYYNYDGTNITASITCNGKDFANGEELRAVLSQPFPSNAWLSLGLEEITFPLPKNLLGDNKLLNDIFFTCSYNNAPVIHPLAFEGVSLSANGRFGVAFEFCNLTGLSFGFLSAMQSVQKLQLWKSSLGTFVDFPHLPTLTYLEFLQTNIDDWYPYKNTPNLVYLAFGDLGPADVASIVSYLPDYPNLETLRLDKNKLDSIPQQIQSLTKLEHLTMSLNPFKVLRSGSLRLQSALTELNLDGCSIASIEEGAFDGDFSKTTIYLNSNSLTTFDEAVFKSLLTSMYASTGQIILGSGHNFACGCDIEWLVKDNRHLLERLNGAVCSNGTAFADLNPIDFNCAGRKAARDDYYASRFDRIKTKTLQVALETAKPGKLNDQYPSL